MKTKNNKERIAAFQVDENLSLEEQIAQRAHEIWKERGHAHGGDWSDWFRAERELHEWHQRRAQFRQNQRDAR